MKGAKSFLRFVFRFQVPKHYRLLNETTLQLIRKTMPDAMRVMSLLLQQYLKTKTADHMRSSKIHHSTQQYVL